MKKVILCFLLSALLVSGCSSEKKGKPADISQVIWDKSIQYASMADQYKDMNNDGEKNNAELLIAALDLKGLDKESASEEKLIDNVYKMVSGKSDSLYGGSVEIKKEGAKRFEKARKEVVKIVGEGALDSNPSSDSTEQSTTNSPKHDYIAEYYEANKLKAKDVQFDMANNLDKDFALDGIARLDDYYNYGFGPELESDYFCARITPDDGSDDWYAYFHRGSFEDLFEALKSNDVYVNTTSIIPKWRFEEGQDNMAMVQSAKW